MTQKLTRLFQPTCFPLLPLTAPNFLRVRLKLSTTALRLLRGSSVGWCLVCGQCGLCRMSHLRHFRWMGGVRLCRTCSWQVLRFCWVCCLSFCRMGCRLWLWLLWLWLCHAFCWVCGCHDLVGGTGLNFAECATWLHTVCAVTTVSHHQGKLRLNFRNSSCAQHNRTSSL